MRLDIQHSFSVGATLNQAWSFLWNIEAVAKCIPGCEEVLVREQGTSYQARVRRHVGPFLIRFELDIAVAQSSPPHRIEVVVSGDDKRLRSQIRQSIIVSLTEVEAGQCQIDLATSFELSGMLASLGERLLGAQIQQELDIFASCIQNSLEREAASVSG